jgi:hypothetical protein
MFQYFAGCGDDPVIKGAVKQDLMAFLYFRPGSGPLRLDGGKVTVVDGKPKTVGVTLQILTTLKYADAVDGMVSRATAAKSSALCRLGRSAVNFMHLTQVSNINVYAYNPHINSWYVIAGYPRGSCGAYRVQ